MPSTYVEVDVLPSCDLCSDMGVDRKAQFDASMKDGRWAFLCLEHMQERGTGVGLGRGQELKLRKPCTESAPTQPDKPSEYNLQEIEGILKDIVSKVDVHETDREMGGCIFNLAGLFPVGKLAHSCAPDLQALSPDKEVHAVYFLGIIRGLEMYRKLEQLVAEPALEFMAMGKGTAQDCVFHAETHLIAETARLYFKAKKGVQDAEK